MQRHDPRKEVVEYLQQKKILPIDTQTQFVQILAMNIQKELLQQLDLFNITKITDLQSLVAVSSLKVDNSIIDIPRIDIQSLIDFNRLTSYNTKIYSIFPIQKLVNLTQLIISNNRISDLSPISNLTNLTCSFMCLSAFLNIIIDLTPLRNLINLQILDLQGNKISDISPLSNLVNITRLNLSANKINSLKSLSGMKHLTELRAVKNQITDLSPLSTLKLQILCLDKNNIVDITPLENIPLLQLSITNNSVIDITPLKPIPKLDTILNKILFQNECQERRLIQNHPSNIELLRYKKMKMVNETTKTAHKMINKQMWKRFNDVKSKFIVQQAHIYNQLNQTVQLFLVLLSDITY
ncbi:leucine_Rich Repeat (LRR)-containing protein [Hexamita inflata]|uniref:Partial n=1 Tax=Hexamita inflata TaxID=28002 RepID=A0AA86PQK5_9EUKA|nr:leucine Rich Repeat (LRR)-containing protein [Hexamita inflata]